MLLIKCIKISLLAYVLGASYTKQTYGSSLLEQDITLQDTGRVRHQSTIEAGCRIVHFFPPSGTYQRKLTSLELFYSSRNVPGGIIFQGTICPERFIRSMGKTLEHFHFFFGRFDYEGNDLYIKYDGSNPAFFIQLEVDEKTSKKEYPTARKMMPHKIDKRLLSKRCWTSLKGMPLASFKLTRWDDSFALGFTLNHVFFDMGTFRYFLKFMSTTYTQGESRFIKDPVIFEDTFVGSSAPLFANLSEFRSFGKKVGWEYWSPLTLVKNALIYGWRVMNEPCIHTHLYLNRSEIGNVIRSAQERGISENDVIHGIFLKIYAMNPRFSPNQPFSLGYVANMRKRLGQGEEVLGNLGQYLTIKSRIAEIKGLDIPELAQFNRSKISETSAQEIERFKQYLSWTKHFKDFKQNESSYAHTCDVSSLAQIFSNVSSMFNSNEVAFGATVKGARFLIQENPPLIPQTMVSNVDPEHILLPLAIPYHYLDEVVKLGRDTNLFQVVSFPTRATKIHIGMKKALDKVNPLPLIHRLFYDCFSSRRSASFKRNTIMTPQNLTTR